MFVVHFIKQYLIFYGNYIKCLARKVYFPTHGVNAVVNTSFWGLTWLELNSLKKNPVYWSIFLWLEHECGIIYLVVACMINEAHGLYEKLYQVHAISITSILKKIFLKQFVHRTRVYIGKFVDKRSKAAGVLLHHWGIQGI